ncbi:hypothetical protein AB0E08_24750 [Streptomyces sp. NPDC048281]|uniref:hypothetical protein n=1 Tax=Streptomyces sp. NPDC048281 TaxID=3154715 RepID=UPI00343122FB
MISDFRIEYSVSHRVSCRVPAVNESWFYKRRTRQPTQREQRRQQLIEAVREEIQASGGTYSSPKIWIRLVRHPIWSCDYEALTTCFEAMTHIISDGSVPTTRLGRVRGVRGGGVVGRRW